MKEIKAFVVSLDLPLSQAQDLTSKLEGDSNLAAFLRGKDYDASGLISLACQSAQTCFGDNSVDTTPVDQGTVEGTWSIVFSAQERQKLTIMMKVSSLLAFSDVRCNPRINTRCIQDAKDYQFLPNGICRP